MALINNKIDVKRDTKSEILPREYFKWLIGLAGVFIMTKQFFRIRKWIEVWLCLYRYQMFIICFYEYYKCMTTMLVDTLQLGVASTGATVWRPWWTTSRRTSPIWCSWCMVSDRRWTTATSSDVHKSELSLCHTYTLDIILVMF